MKIYKYISLSIMLLSLLVACEPSHLEDNLNASVVSFSRSGIEPVLFYDVEGKYNYSFYAVNAGYYAGDTEVEVIKDVQLLNRYNDSLQTSLQELPTDCYTLVTTKGHISGKEKTCKFDIQFDCEKLRALALEADYSDLENYIIPLSLTGDGKMSISEKSNTLFIQPDMRRVPVALEEAGEVTIPKSKIKGQLEFSFSFKTAIDNNWETKFDVLSGDDAIQHINNNLIKRASLTSYSSLVGLPSDAYTVIFDNIMKPGTSTTMMTVKVDANKIPEGCTSLACYLTEASIAGEVSPIEGSPYSIIHFQNVDSISTVGKVQVDKDGNDATYLGKYLSEHGYSVLPRDGWVFSPESYQGTSYTQALDGKTSSHWENRYNNNGVGPTGFLPLNTILDLGAVKEFTAIEIWRRLHNTYVKDLRAFEIYISDDATNWKYVTSIDYGTGAEQRAMYDIFQKVNARYINLYVTRSNRGANVSIAEIHLWNK